MGSFGKFKVKAQYIYDDIIIEEEQSTNLKDLSISEIKLFYFYLPR